MNRKLVDRRLVARSSLRTCEGTKLDRILQFLFIVALCHVCDTLLPVQFGLASAGVLFGLWSAWLGAEESRSSPLHISPLVTYQFWQALTLGISPVYLALKYSADEFVPWGPKTLELSTVAHGHAVLTCGSLFLYAGMKHFEPKWKIARSKNDRIVTGQELLMGFAIGTFILVFTLEIRLLLGSVVAGLDLLPMAALSLFAVKARSAQWSKKGMYWLVLMIGTIALLLLYSKGDSKLMLVFSFVPLGSALIIRNKVVPIVVFGSGVVVFYLLVIAPLVTSIRTAERTETEGRKSILNRDALYNTRTQLVFEFNTDPIEYLRNSLDHTMLRLCDSVPAGAVYGIATSNGLLNGIGMEYVATALIPRAVWHDKPTIERGRYFTAALGQSSDESLATTSTGQTAAGELYWNFGWIGVSAGMYILGAAISGVWWRACEGNPMGGVFEMTAFLGVSLFFAVGLGSAAGGAFVTAISSGIILRGLIGVRDRVESRRGRNHRFAGVPLRYTWK